MKKISSLLFFTLAFSLASTLYAAPVSVEDVTGSMTIIVSPEAPRPNESVELKLEASGLNLNSSTITWTANGTIIKRGVGEKSITYNVGELGVRTVIDVSVESEDQDYSQSVTLNPAEIDLMWQGSGFVHPFYDGRTPWTRQTQLVVLAMPQIIGSNGTPLNPESLNYRWKQNNLIVGSASGIGRNTFVFNDTVLSKPQTIVVEVMSGSTILARNSINLTPGSPEVLVYEDNPLYGYLFHKEAGGSHYMTSEETRLAAFPFFFSASSRFAGNIQYEWRNGSSPVDKGPSVTYRVPGKEAGSSRVSLKLTSSDRVMQSANKTFLIEFNK